MELFCMFQVYGSYEPVKLFQAWNRDTFCPFPLLANKFFKVWVTWQNFWDIKWFWIFFIEKFFFNFAFFSYFLYLFINIVKKLEVTVLKTIMEDIPVSFSLFGLGFLSFSFSFTFYLSLSLSLSLLMPHFSCCYVA